MRETWFTSLLFVFILCLGGGTSSAIHAQEATAEQAESSTTEVEKAAEVEESIEEGKFEDPEEIEEQVAEAPKWVKTVDEWFGTYLVVPLFTVLFYDFETGDWLGTSIPFVVLWLFMGAIFFTLRMGFINVRAFWHAITITRGDYDNPDEEGEVSHFQALTSALSATVGLGNIAGVAIAVSAGGPGAIFWMIVAGVLGMSSKFAECTLGQMYRKVSPDGTVSGGPMHYLKDGLAELGLGPLGLVLSILFAILCVGASFGGGCAFQVVQSLNSVEEQLPWLEAHRYVYGLIMAAAVGVVIIGGIRSIGATAEKIVPLMCGVYVATALIILVMKFDQIPAAFALIFERAFSAESVGGGIIGVMVTGITRSAFSNEAGIGSASIAHSAARTDEPVSEGIVALLEPFIDTVIVCTMTGLVIVITGAYDRTDPTFADAITTGEGARLTSLAFGSVLSWFPIVLSVAVVLFAFSTMISWSYYGERCWSYLVGDRFSMIYKMVFLGFVFLGSIVTPQNVLDFSDLMILSMAFPNILGVALLSGKVKRTLDDYWGRHKRGELEKFPKEEKV
ncbi:Amino-acid carrier protein AlsT [Planctomycetales bacterium 10988]|nr:Amino-acid carrier protein AlsT [Planctomycetales bacterium 10988]